MFEDIERRAIERIIREHPDAHTRNLRAAEKLTFRKNLGMSAS